MFRRRRGFTLIELLVVVSIIALLVSILLPALGGAREQARAVVCSTQMKQILLALQMYADDNAECTFPELFDLDMGLNLPWDVALAPYFSAQVKDDSAKGYIACPADNKKRATPEEIVERVPLLDGIVGHETLPRSYMLNGALQNMPDQNGSSSPLWWSDKSGRPQRLGNVSFPLSEMIWFVELHIGSGEHDRNYMLKPSDLGWEGGVQGTLNWAGTWFMPNVKGFAFNGVGRVSGYAQESDQHEKGGNWPFMDGHVEWVRHSFDGDKNNLDNAYQNARVTQKYWLPTEKKRSLHPQW